MIGRIFFALTLAALAIKADAAIPVSPLSDIYQSYNDCLAVAEPAGISQSKLAELGWVQGTTEAQGGKSATDALLIYGKAGRKPLIILSSASGAGLCIVTARIASRSTFAEFLKAWGGALPAADNEGVISFKDEGHLVQIRQTGTDQEPALSMGVMTPEKK